LGGVLALISWIAATTVFSSDNLPRTIPYIRQEKQTQAKYEDEEEFLKVLPSDSIMSSKHWDRSPIVATKFKLLFYRLQVQTADLLQSYFGATSGTIISRRL
jgi:hypothetical protein